MINHIESFALVNNYLEKTIKESKTLDFHIKDIMIYSSLNGGKRVRPILSLLSGQLFNEINNDLLDIAIGLEFIHSYSLVHDDLPAIDNDDMRRGILTTHKKFGEDYAIISGDGLLNFAYEVMLRNNLNNNKIEAISYIANKSGINGMVGGQSLDISKYKPIDIISLNKIYFGKTCALLQASLVGGALCLGGKEYISVFEEIGYNLGLAFQYVDDILDVTADPIMLGKDVNQDDKNGKITSVTLLGLDAAKKEAIELTNKAYNLLDKIDKDTSFLKNYFDILLKRLN